MKRREVPQRERATPPPWVVKTLDGLRKFDGDLAALHRARAQWCRDHGCYRNCAAWAAGNCRDRKIRAGIVHVPPYRIDLEGAILADDWGTD